MLQIVLFAIGILIFVLRGLRHFVLGNSFSSVPDLVLNFAFATVCIAAVVWIRHGHLRGAVYLVLSALLLASWVAFGSVGLTGQREGVLVSAFILVFGALFLGRNALWMCYAGTIVAFWLGAVHDSAYGWSISAIVGVYKVHGFINAVMITTMVALVLDRFGATLSDALREVTKQSEALEIANAEIRAKESRFRGAREGSLDAFFLCESVRDELGEIDDFEFVDMNARGAALFGLEKEQMIGQRVCKLLTEVRASGSFPNYVEVVENGITFEEELRPASPIFEAEWIRQQVVKVGDGLAITARDITEEKQAEVEQERLQAQLLQAQKLESVGLLAGGVAHDFNNVLTVVMGHAEMVGTMMSETDPAQANVKEVLAAGEQGTRLTRQLLALSRKQPSAPQLVSPNDRILAFDHMLRRVIGSNYELTTIPGDEVGAVRIDPGQLEQVLLNLAVNARDAMPDGGMITIATEDVSFVEGAGDRQGGLAAGRYVALSIRDTGMGMNAEILPSIFDPFFTTKHAGKGTGLGLAICNTIVEESGGRIIVESEPRVGSTFTVYLPVVSGPAVDSEADAEPCETDFRGTETVLFLDDNSSVRSIMTAGLTTFGYKVLSTSLPSEAVRLVEINGRVKLLVADMVLPQQSGLKVAQALQQQRPDLKVLLVSGYIGSEVWDRVVESGYAFLQKPFTATALARKVREVLDR